MRLTTKQELEGLSKEDLIDKIQGRELLISGMLRNAETMLAFKNGTRHYNEAEDYFYNLKFELKGVNLTQGRKYSPF